VRTTDLDPVAMLQATATLKRHAAVTDDLAVAPGLRATADDPTKKLAVLRAMFAIGTPVVLGVSLAELVLLTAGAVLQPWWAAAAVGAYAVQPRLALSGSAIAPRDLSRSLLLRLPAAWLQWVRTVIGRWRPDVATRPDDLRDEYEALLAGGLERFFEPRRPDCPVCDSTDLVVKLRTPDLQQGKPGEFVLEECGECHHIFQNPRLSLEGLDFYYKDFYDGLGEESLEFVFGAGSESYQGRARMVEGLTEPRRWLDVGAGHGHFCLVAREVWPDTVFDGLDLSESIESAERRRWVDQGYRGLFPDLADDLAGRYDVVSMHHYLEHTREPFEEIEAAARVLAPGGYLLIEVPDPSSTFGRLLGRHWVPWFQTQHQHLLSIENLEWALGERGFTPLRQHRGEAHQPVDLVFAVYMLINRLAPPTDQPWRPPPTLAARMRRAALFTAGVPFLAGALVLDHLLAVGVRRGSRSNTYRVLARREEVPAPTPPADEARELIDLRQAEPVS
jgi:SAM-dependent methyltransferase